MLISMSGAVSAQQYIYITGLNITQVSESQIKANLKIHTSLYSEYNAYTTETNGNIITLKVCYTLFFFDSSEHDQDFFVNIPTTPGNYTFKVEAYIADFDNCVYESQYMDDTVSLDFTNPFDGTIFLDTAEPGNKTDDIVLFPNPATAILNIETSLKIEKINVYDTSGKIVKTLQNARKTIDVSRLQKGVYHLEIFTDKGKVLKKIVVGN
jgi:hypothetical protein